jgi:hypothetical protein
VLQLMDSIFCFLVFIIRTFHNLCAFAEGSPSGSRGFISCVAAVTEGVRDSEPYPRPTVIEDIEKKH